MARAFSTLGCPEADLRTAVALAKRYQVDALELRALADTINLPAYFATEFGTPDGFGEAMRDLGVTVVALDTSLRLADVTSSEREQFLSFVPWAEAAGIKWLRVLDGGAKLGDRGALTAAASGVRWWREVRADSRFNVDIMVETHDHLLTGAAIARFVAAVPNTAILWDAHHTWRQGHEDPATTWREVRGHVVHIHVKDSVGVPTATHPYRFVLPGTGEFPMASLRRTLAEDKFGGVVSLEWEKLWHPELPPIDEALRAAAKNNWW